MIDSDHEIHLIDARNNQEIARIDRAPIVPYQESYMTGAPFLLGDLGMVQVTVIETMLVDARPVSHVQVLIGLNRPR